MVPRSDFYMERPPPRTSFATHIYIYMCRDHSLQGVGTSKKSTFSTSSSPFAPSRLAFYKKARLIVPMEQSTGPARPTAGGRKLIYIYKLIKLALGSGEALPRALLKFIISWAFNALGISILE